MSKRSYVRDIYRSIFKMLKNVNKNISNHNSASNKTWNLIMLQGSSSQKGIRKQNRLKMCDQHSKNTLFFCLDLFEIVCILLFQENIPFMCIKSFKNYFSNQAKSSRLIQLKHYFHKIIFSSLSPFNLLSCFFIRKICT